MEEISVSLMFLCALKFIRPCGLLNPGGFAWCRWLW